MSQDKITKYYLLCTVRMGGKAHIVSELTAPQLGAIFTKKEVDLYLRPTTYSVTDASHGVVYTARELVIGGGNDSTMSRGGNDSTMSRGGKGHVMYDMTGPLVYRERQPVVMIL